MPLAFSMLLDMCVFLLPLCWLVFSYGTILRKLHVDISMCGGIRRCAGRCDGVQERKWHSMPMATYGLPTTAHPTAIKTSSITQSNANANVDDKQQSVRELRTVFENGSDNIGQVCVNSSNGSVDGNDEDKVGAFEKHTLPVDVHPLQQNSTSQGTSSSRKVFLQFF